jgi:two-component system KDP operon response regulator KdpE
MTARILNVNDHEQTRYVVGRILERGGFEVAEAGSGEEALRLAGETPPDLVLLDLGLPDMDGQDVLVRLREWLRAPIIVLSVRDQERQKIMALEHGADDYLTKPFSTGELLARIQVAFRHAAQDASGAATPVFTCGELVIDSTARRVTVGGEDVRLTRLEYKLLVTMAQHAGKVLTHPGVHGGTAAEDRARAGAAAVSDYRARRRLSVGGGIVHRECTWHFSPGLWPGVAFRNAWSGATPGQSPGLRTSAIKRYEHPILRKN